MKNYIRQAAIDHGYDSVKIYDGNHLKTFKSKYEKTNGTINTNKTFKIIWGDESYVVGDGATSSFLEYDKTENEYNKVFTLAALGSIMHDNYDEFNIVAGYPLNLYSTNRNIFAKYLKGNGVVRFVFNGIEKSLKINDCLVFPQGAGAIFQNPVLYKDKLIAVLDIGGLTINGCLFDNLNLNTSSMFTVNQGCIILFNKLKKALNNHYTLNIQEYEIPQILQNGLIVNGERVNADKLIDSVVFDHCNLIKSECRRYNWNIETLNIVLIGGGAYILDGYIQTIMPQVTIIEDPIFANVKGFYEVGRHYYAKNF